MSTAPQACYKPVRAAGQQGCLTQLCNSQPEPRGLVGGWWWWGAELHPRLLLPNCMAPRGCLFLINAHKARWRPGQSRFRNMCLGKLAGREVCNQSCWASQAASRGDQSCSHLGAPIPMDRHVQRGLIRGWLMSVSFHIEWGTGKEGAGWHIILRTAF